MATAIDFDPVEEARYLGHEVLWLLDARTHPEHVATALGFRNVRTLTSALDRAEALDVEEARQARQALRETLAALNDARSRFP